MTTRASCASRHQQIDAHTTDEGELLPGLRLALMHHPLTDLADHTSARRLLAATVDLVTHGHQHMPGFVETTDPDRRLAVLAAGCLYEGDAGDRWVNRFHVLNVETNDRGPTASVPCGVLRVVRE
jgi:predicted phosphodiesterase